MAAAGCAALLPHCRRRYSTCSLIHTAASAPDPAAARCLDGQSGSGEESGRPEEHAEQAAAAAGVRACCQAGAPAMSAVAEEEQEPSAFSVLSSIDVRALVLGGGSGSDSGCATPAGARDISPHGTLDAAHEAMTAFASGRTGGAVAGRPHAQAAGSRAESRWRLPHHAPSPLFREPRPGGPAPQNRGAVLAAAAALTSPHLALPCLPVAVQPPHPRT